MQIINKFKLRIKPIINQFKPIIKLEIIKPVIFQKIRKQIPQHVTKSLHCFGGRIATNSTGCHGSHGILRIPGDALASPKKKCINKGSYKS